MKKKLFIFISIFLIIVFIPLFFDWCLWGNNFPSNISNSDWASFLGGYCGGIATLAAVMFTLHNNKKQLEAQNKEEKKQREEDRRVAILPYIDNSFNFFKSGTSLNPGNYVININVDENGIENGGYEIVFNKNSTSHFETQKTNPLLLYFSLKNIGAGSAVNGEMILESINKAMLFSIAKDETKEFFFNIDLQSNKEYILNIKYSYWDAEMIAKYSLDCVLAINYNAKTKEYNVNYKDKKKSLPERIMP